MPHNPQGKNICSLFRQLLRRNERPGQACCHTLPMWRWLTCPWTAITRWSKPRCRAGQDASGTPSIHHRRVPTNPRVEVPDLDDLKEVLSRNGEPRRLHCYQPVFVLIKRFARNNFLGGEILSTVRTIAYVSGLSSPVAALHGGLLCRKRPDGCLERRSKPRDCDNRPPWRGNLGEAATVHEAAYQDAYRNTRIRALHPRPCWMQINFVSEELARKFHPFRVLIDLPTKGSTDEGGSYKTLNLSSSMDDRRCWRASSAELRAAEGCYWTIPATFTKEPPKGDKDYIVVWVS